MRRVYLKPDIEEIGTELAMLICGSKDIYSDKGIGYGGVDEEGALDPASRRIDVWDE
jgi:hypothetical protein